MEGYNRGAAPHGIHASCDFMRINAAFGDELAEASAGTALKDAVSRVDFFEAPQAGHFPA